MRAHYWARQLLGFGHVVRLVPVREIRPNALLQDDSPAKRVWLASRRLRLSIPINSKSKQMRLAMRRIMPGRIGRPTMAPGERAREMQRVNHDPKQCGAIRARMAAMEKRDPVGAFASVEMAELRGKANLYCGASM